MTNSNSDASKTDAKKVWQKLELKQVDVPSATKGGAGRIDPGEGFFAYRNS
jgi:hypothetical protein